MKTEEAVKGKGRVVDEIRESCKREVQRGMVREGNNDAYFTPARQQQRELSASGNAGWWDAVGMPWYVNPPDTTDST